MKILLFGSTGMVGNYVLQVLSKNYKIICITRKEFDIENDSWCKLDKILQKYNDENITIINCAGVMPQNVDIKKYKSYITINSLFPHKLQEIVEKYNYKFIHITTNGIFDGLKGNYIETDIHTETDIYGVSKSLGEPENTCIIRTSIIGEELLNKKGLLEWVISQKDQTIQGYTNYLWNGVTCLTLANIIKEIINKNTFWVGVRHIYSPESVTKYVLCNYINEIYDLNITIEMGKTMTKNMTLSSNILTDIIPIKEQIIEQKHFNLKLGTYKNLTKCRFCDNNIEKLFTYENNVPLAGGFLTTERDSLYEKLYPLTLVFCNNCKTGMVKEIIESNHLFTQINNNGYFFYSSTIQVLVNHFQDLSKLVITNYPDKKKILEIGCNDGVFLNNFLDKDYYLIGVDPSITIKKLDSSKIFIYNNFFDDATTDLILTQHGKLDIIVACNCLAHIDNINSIYSNIKKILAADGVAIIEVHYLKDLIDNINFDFIYHEHMSYYSINTVISLCKTHNLYLQKVDYITSHGGSIRIYLTHRHTEKLFDECITNNLNKESNLRTSINQFITKTALWKTKMVSYIKDLKKQNIKIVGYGASGRTNMIISYLNIDFDYIIDDSEEKINSLMPISHTSISNSNIIYTNNISTVIILAWPYTKYIVNTHIKFLETGGTFIKILPEIQEISIDNYIDFIN